DGRARGARREPHSEAPGQQRRGDDQFDDLRSHEGSFPLFRCAGAAGASRLSFTQRWAPLGAGWGEGPPKKDRAVQKRTDAPQKRTEPSKKRRSLPKKGLGRPKKGRASPKKDRAVPKKDRPPQKRASPALIRLAGIALIAEGPAIGPLLVA